MAVQTVLDLEDNPAARTAQVTDVTEYRAADRLRASGFVEELPH